MSGTVIDGKAVAASIMLEAMVFATLGAFAGTAVVWVWLDGFLYNGAWNVFEVTVNLHLFLVAIGWGTTIALIGTLPLLLRTLRRNELDTLQNLSVVGESVSKAVLNWTGAPTLEAA